MRFTILAAVALWSSAAAVAQAGVPAEQALGRSVAELSSMACYGIESGAVVLPSAQSPDRLDQMISAVEKLGLQFGIDNKVLTDLGPAGVELVS